MIRPIATSLPGMIRDEKITVSPSVSLSSWLPDGDPAERRARLALAAGGDDQHILARQAHRLVERDRRGEIAQIAGRLGDAQDPVERAAGDAHPPPGLDRDLADGLQPRGVGREGRDQHPPLRRLDLRAQPGVDAFLRSRRLGLEHVGRIAHQGEHALVADPRQHLGARRLAKHRRVVDLPVAGVEHAAERSFDEQPVALGNRVRKRDEADLERPQLDGAAAFDDVELDQAGQPFLLELSGDQPGGEGRRVERRLQLLREIGQGADMVLVAVGQDDPGEPVLLALR